MYIYIPTIAVHYFAPRVYGRFVRGIVSGCVTLLCSSPQMAKRQRGAQMVLHTVTPNLKLIEAMH